MAKFCETMFAQSELMVYKNFVKNYNTYRMIWSGDAEAEKLEPDSIIASASESLTVADAKEVATTTKADARAKTKSSRLCSSNDRGTTTTAVAARTAARLANKEKNCTCGREHC